MSKNIVFYVLLSLVTLVSCTRPANPQQPAPGNKYASGFTLQMTDSGMLATVYQPLTEWQNGQREVQAQYLFDNQVHRIATTSCTHIGFLGELQMLGRVVAVCNPELIYTPLPDSIPSLGDALAPSVERAVQAGVEQLLFTSYGQGEEIVHRMRQLGIQVIYNNEWTESSPLARAEWIRFMGAMCGCYEQADSVFGEIERRYIEAMQSPLQVRSQSYHKVLIGSNFRGTWYLPSGNTYMGCFLRDAGANYPYLDDMRPQSIPCTLEQVIADFQDATVWLGAPARTLDELAALDEKHTWFEAYRSGRIYHWMAQSTPAGANNFWERAVVHPEEVLLDIRTILSSPDTVPASSLIYAAPLR